MKLKLYFVLLTSFLPFAFALGRLFSFEIYGQQTVQEKELISILHKISSHDILDYVNEMTEPKYKGRLAGTPEYMEIAQWAANLFERWGIESFGDDGSYFQYFDNPYCEVLNSGRLELLQENKLKKYHPKEDYYPGANSSDGKIKAQVVFAGYGITATELNYDDYAGIDVEDKIVLVNGGVPYAGDNAQASAKWTFFNSHRYKYSNAFEHGAKGVLVVDMLASPGTPYLEDFYYCSVSKKVADDIFEYEKLNFDTIIKQISSELNPRSFITQSVATIESSTKCYAKGQTANVIGFIEGSDNNLKNEVILAGAHLDGQGYLGFYLPGALDNASGVANILAAAEALSKMKGKMKRSVIFVLFGGEECGLLGSIHYVENPKLPLENIILMINLDVVGNGSGLAVWGGKSYPALLTHFENANENFIHRPIISSENTKVIGRPRLDGLVFLMNNIPTIHLGITDREFPVYYHSHKDTPDLLSYETMEDAAKLLFLSVFNIANY